LNKTGDWRVEF